MAAILDRLNELFPAIHSILFVIGVLSNGGLLLASFKRNPRLLNTYSVLIKIGALNDLVSVCADFFTMQRMLVIPGNLIYLSNGPCSLISVRSCYLAYCLQLCTLGFSLCVMVASFGYRLWILHRPSPSTRQILILMIMLFLLQALIGFAFTFTQADIEIVREFLRQNAPSYLREPGALSGHSGFTFLLVFTILFGSLTPGPTYVAIMVIRHKILSKLRQQSEKMSKRTKNMHSNLVKALTVHAMLPPIYCFAVIIYIVLFFGLFQHATLEKAIYAIAAIPNAFSAFCSLYYVEPYQRFILCRPAIESPAASNFSEMRANSITPNSGRHYAFPLQLSIDD